MKHRIKCWLCRFLVNHGWHILAMRISPSITGEIHAEMIMEAFRKGLEEGLEEDDGKTD